MRIVAALAMLVAAPAIAQDTEERTLRPAIQLDLGLAVVGAGYEQPIGPHLGVMLEAQVFSTYFAPWFDVGDDLAGFGGELRVTYLFREGGRGPYAAAFLRVNRVTADDAVGVGYSAGAMGGWAFGLGERVDLRLGAGLQYLHYRAPPAEFVGPFVHLDLVLGVRL